MASRTGARILVDQLLIQGVNHAFCPWTRGALAYAALAVACLDAYQPALHGGFLWDDDFYVSANPHLADLAGLKRLWTDTGAVPQYYPLTFTTFWIEHQIWGLDTTGYHVVNVLLHALSAFLLLHVLRRLEIPGGWLAAALFALHPVHVESVAWITERKNTLSGVFYLGAALAYLTFAADRRRRFGVLAVVLFLAALLSKSVTASLPAVLALVLVWREGRLDRRHGPWLGGMLLVGAAKGVLTAVLEVTQVGAHGAEWAIGPVERTLLAGRIVWFYLGKLAWPHPLAFVYERWPVDASAWWWWILPLAAVALVAALAWFRGRIGSGPLVAVLFG